MIERLVAIGHVTEDTAEPENVIGGGVSYAGIAARNLGLEVQIVTKLPDGHRFINTLIDRGINVLAPPTQNSGVTTFANVYDSTGARKQVILDRQDTIEKADMDRLSLGNLQNSVFLVAPVMDEVDAAIIPHLAMYGVVAVTPQGYFREAQEDGTVFQAEWKEIDEALSAASITILSEEDIAIGGAIDEGLLGRIKNASPVTVLTRGRMGATVYEGINYFNINAFPLSDEDIKDFTGAGDVFAAAFIAKIMKTRNSYEAGVFATFFAAAKLTGMGGTGVDSVPDLSQLERFRREHASEVESFLKMNNANDSDLKL